MKKAFSLIELLISLIIISLIISVFIPILTKRNINNNLTLSNDTKITSECENFGDKCILCVFKKKCLLCEKICADTQYLDIEKCNCNNCSDLIDGCNYCTSKSCTKCKINYGLSDDKLSCTKCASNEYSTGETSCIKCSTFDANCLSCSSSGCTGCSHGHVLFKGKCYACNLSTSILINGVCVLRYNAGDPGGLPIPSDVSVGMNRNADAYCWKGNTTKDCSGGAYCNRTVCTWYAADIICQKNNMRLPTIAETQTFKDYYKELHLCQWGGGKAQGSYCLPNSCPGATTTDGSRGGCSVDHIWTSSPNASFMYGGSGKFGISSQGPFEAKGVLCVR